MKTNLKKTLLASSIVLALGAPSVEAALVTGVLGANTWSTDSANFGLLGANGGTLGFTNDLALQWDGNAYNNDSDYTGPGSAANVTASSTTPFYGSSWTMHDIQVFMPGSYSFDVALGGGNSETGSLGATVGAGQLGMHMLFDWSGNLNIDMFIVFDQNSIFGSGLLYSTQPTSPYGSNSCDVTYTGTITQNCLYDGPNYGSAGAPIKDQVWMLASADPDGDGIMGIPMASGGPFEGYSANVNANLVTSELAPVPISATAWLFGSGLMGLAAARRRKVV